MLLLSLVSLVLHVPAAAEDFPSKVKLAALQATVRIQCGNNQGSGVLLGQKDGEVYVLTAWHVVEVEDAKARNVNVAVFTLESYPNPAKTYPADLIAHVEKNDLAILRVKTTDKMPGSARLCPSGQLPPAGSFPALACGSVGNRFPTPRAETVLEAKKIRAGRMEMKAWEVELSQPEGYSGGPLLDREGRLLGIASGESGGRGYCSHTDEIRALLVRAKLEWLAGE